MRDRLMCMATGEAAGQNLYEALLFQHSLARLPDGLTHALAVFDIDHQPELGRSWA
jgi:hypothetical protein